MTYEPTDFGPGFGHVDHRPPPRLPRNRGDWMQTYTGRAFYPFDPVPEEIDIEDIAHALSMLCRYGGHSNVFYSVAEHSVYVSTLLPQELKLVGLLHDATEAYLVDMPRPIKKGMPQYRDVEDRLWTAVARRFDLPEVLPQAVHDADVAMLFAEQSQLLKPSPLPGWGMGLSTPITERPRIRALYPREAEQLFLAEFEHLATW